MPMLTSKQKNGASSAALALIIDSVYRIINAIYTSFID